MRADGAGFTKAASRLLASAGSASSRGTKTDAKSQGVIRIDRPRQLTLLRTHERVIPIGHGLLEYPQLVLAGMSRGPSARVPHLRQPPNTKRYKTKQCCAADRQQSEGRALPPSEGYCAVTTGPRPANIHLEAEQLRPFASYATLVSTAIVLHHTRPVGRLSATVRATRESGLAVRDRQTNRQKGRGSGGSGYRGRYLWRTCHRVRVYLGDYPSIPRTLSEYTSLQRICYAPFGLAVVAHSAEGDTTWGSGTRGCRKRTYKRTDKRI